ncbi:MAG: hypothetical protein AAFR58_25800 [Cyanobacteria bacterium J06627_28]
MMNNENAEKMVKALAASGGGTAILANVSTAGGISVAAAGAPAIIVSVGAAAAIAAAGYGAYVGYEALKKKLNG